MPRNSISELTTARWLSLSLTLFWLIGDSDFNRVPADPDRPQPEKKLRVVCPAKRLSDNRERQLVFEPAVESVLYGSVAKKTVPFTSLHGQEGRPIRLLAARPLLFEKRAALPKLVIAIERDMFRQARQAPGEFRRLKNAIQLLGRMERETPTGALSTLLERELAFLDTKPPQPSEIQRSQPERDRGGEVEADDVNHSLAWIAATMDEQPLADRFGKRLVELRNSLNGRWKQEVQLALDSSNVEDNLELAALRKNPAEKPVSSRRLIHQPGGIKAIAFSHNGKHLATSGYWRDVFIWNADDWSLARALDLPARISSLVFSPDDRLLYVAGESGDGAESHAVHCRFDWRAGKLDKSYDGQGKGVHQIALSADGKTMIGLSLADQTVRVWDVDSARIVRRLDWRGTHFVYAPTKTLLFLLAGFRRRSVLLPLSDPRSAPITSLSEFAGAAFTPDERHLLTVGDSLQLRMVDSGFPLVKEQPLPELTDHDTLAISADGRFAAIASTDWRVAIVTLPDLKPVKQLGALSSKLVDYDSVPSIAFSPEGKWLAEVDEMRTRPRFLRVPSGEEVIPVEGHGSFVVDLRFSPDGLTLRSVGRDGTVCSWDTAKMKMLRRFSVPTGHRLVSIRPFDGRYGLCVNINAPKSPGQVLDLETGAVLCQVPLPPSDEGLPRSEHWDGGMTRLFWLSDSEALATIDGHWHRFNYRTGQALGAGEIDIDKNIPLFNGCGEPTEDGTRLFYAHDGGKRTLPWEAEETLLPGLELQKLGKVDTKGNPEGPAGLVPGGKYFYIGTQIFDRHSLKRVATKDFARRSVDRLSFNADGSRYVAAVSQDRNRSERPYRFPVAGKTTELERVHDTLSGRTLLAIPFLKDVEFSRLSGDGRQLAIAQSDGTIQVWRVPR
jgi:WD40 repeat protein